MKLLVKIIPALLMLLLSACASVPKFTSANDHHKIKTEASEKKADIKSEEVPTSDYKNVNPLETKIGIASYYADKFNGRKTANGEIFNMYAMTAAHVSYPLGTIVRVTNLKNNKSVIVRINDRKPDSNDRVIDLSYGAAEKIDMIDSGIAEVKIEVLKWGKGKSIN